MHALFLVLAVSAVQGDSAVYRVEMIRAAPGRLPELIDLSRAWAGVLAAAGEARPVMMRHSQGDQWDLLILSPIRTMSHYFSEERTARLARAGADRDGLTLPAWERHLHELAAWREELFVVGPPVDTVRARDTGAGLYHIEIFRALPGKYDDLVQQRWMENAYYHATGRAGTLVFTRLGGAAWDVVTIGFYPSLLAFATDPDLPADALEAAARSAGFESRATIGTYLRQLIDAHHDTLAGRM